MICKKVVERLSEYWSNELDEATRSEITAHLQSCPTCQREWTLMRAAMNALRGAPTPEPPPELSLRIQSAVRAKQPRKPVLIWRWQWAMAASAAIVVLLVLSLPLLLTVKERARVDKPIVAEMSTPTLQTPALKLPAQPAPSEPPTHLALTPSPAERIAKPKKAMEGLEKERQRKREWFEGEKMPSLQVPTGEQPFGGQPKDMPAEIAPTVEHDAPQIARLPADPREVQFRAELELGKKARVPWTGNVEHAHGPQGPTDPQVPAGPTDPAPSAPAVSAHRSVGAETKTSPVIGQHFPALGQFGGGQAQMVFATPISLRWQRFEPILVGKVRFWELALKAETPQIVTISVQPSERVEILNAQKPTGEERGLVVLRDVLTADKETPLPLLIKANELGARRLLLTVETVDKKAFSWWCIFPVIERESPSQLQRPIPIQVEQWTTIDLLTHLAWEGKLLFLLPEPLANRTITLPTGTVPITNVLALLERQLGGRWIRFGRAFNFISPLPTFVVPMLKQ